MGEMRVRDVLEVTNRMLERVQVPVGMINQVGIPIRDAVHNIRMCIDAIDREAETQAKEPEIEEPAEDEQEQ